MSNPSIFKFESADVRTFADERNELWFLANDVCGVLGYANPRDAIAKHCKEKGVAKRDTLTDKGNQEATFINESNLYRLIIKSRKPEAERFEEWVMDEVLPTIRKTGKYETPYAIGKDDTLTKDEQDALRKIVTQHVESLPKEQQGGAAIKMWSKLKSHFGVPYRLIPRREFAEAVSLLTRATLDNPAPAPTLPQLLTGKRWLVHMTAEGHLIWNEVPPDRVLLPRQAVTEAIAHVWWGGVDTLAALNRLCTAHGLQGIERPQRAA